MTPPVGSSLDLLPSPTPLGPIPQDAVVDTGTRVGAPAPARTVHTAAPAERAVPTGTTTFLFTDIEASSVEWETSPDMPDRLDRHLATLHAAVESSGGVVFSSMGDGIAAAFSSAAAGVRAAIAAQRALPESGLRARMGLHTGEAERVGGDHRGRPVNRAARIMALGHGGQILVSDLCASLVRTGPEPIELVDLGVHRLRGLADPERLWQVVDPALEACFEPVRSAPEGPGDLPRPRTPLLGREREVARVVDLVRSTRVVTLTGPGGVGKTHLALHSLDALRSALDLRSVELAGVPPGATADDVARAVAIALGWAGDGDPLAAAVVGLDHDPTTLLVDGCDHVIDGAAEVVGELVDRCPALTVVATSREPLGLDGEHLVRVRPLRAPAATALLRRWAEAAGVDPDALDDDLCRDVVRRLDGLPLAIELAAARAGTLGLPAILDGLRRCAPLPAWRRRGRADRHATMEATIAWSYDLLEPHEQRLVGWLAVFPDGAELAAVVHVAGRLGLDPGGATDVLASLVDRSLVVADPQPHGVRYRLLETMRGFLLRRLDASGERSSAQRAMAEWAATDPGTPTASPGEGAVVDRRGSGGDRRRTRRAG